MERRAPDHARELRERGACNNVFQCDGEASLAVEVGRGGGDPVPQPELLERRGRQLRRHLRSTRDDAPPEDVALEVDAAVELLDKTERHIMGLAFFRGLTHQEISERTAIPVNSVKTILRNALSVMRERLLHFGVVKESP